ncbi:GNAT family N-acetyltransferase [Cohnella faecalis]|uniref:N-acetyltransferase n=1 Tax=Cohnella faecalis TaxID=2315694 RepID=A0A398CNA0_9BACL|nr:GNAT family protein [Cohnella faecalis]RIE04836.1 N-acetyltransferase [Cohnella faecalis]
MPHLIGDRIVLREYRREDLEPIRAWVNNPEIVCHLSDIFLYPQAMDSTEAYLESMVEGKSDCLGFVIADPADGSYIGQINLDSVDWKNRVGKIGVVIGSVRHLGQGFGTEAMLLLIDFSFREMNLNRLELEVYDFNDRARSCYRKCGFQEEGRLRERQYKNGRYVDVIQMGLLRSEWEAQGRIQGGGED